MHAHDHSLFLHLAKPGRRVPLPSNPALIFSRCPPPPHFVLIKKNVRCCIGSTDWNLLTGLTDSMLYDWRHLIAIHHICCIHWSVSFDFRCRASAVDGGWDDRAGTDNAPNRGGFEGAPVQDVEPSDACHRSLILYWWTPMLEEIIRGASWLGLTSRALRGPCGRVSEQWNLMTSEAFNPRFKCLPASIFHV